MTRNAKSPNAQVLPHGQDKGKSMQIKNTASFPANYSLEVEPELREETPVDIPGRPAERATPLLVRFVPKQGAPWVGRFWGGRERGATGVTTWPDPGMACVIVSGVAYVGSASGPALWEELAPEPTKEVLAFPNLGVIVFCDPWNVRAYGTHGEVWRVGDIATDGFKVTGADAETINIEVERAAGDGDRCRIEVATGRVTRE